MQKESFLETITYNKENYYSRLSTSVVFGALLAYIGKMTNDELVMALIPSIVPIVDFCQHSLFSQDKIYDYFVRKKFLLYSGYKLGIVAAHTDTISNTLNESLEKIVKFF